MENDEMHNEIVEMNNFRDCKKVSLCHGHQDLYHLFLLPAFKMGLIYLCLSFCKTILCLILFCDFESTGGEMRDFTCCKSKYKLGTERDSISNKYL